MKLIEAFNWRAERHVIPFSLNGGQTQQLREKENGNWKKNEQGMIICDFRVFILFLILISGSLLSNFGRAEATFSILLIIPHDFPCDLIICN